ncbi:MAG: serine/threonine protein kinase, partial [Phycisphaerales bacterium]
MDEDNIQRIEALFHAARELDPEHCEAFLNDACGDDDALRREVQTLLEHSDRPTHGLHESLTDATTTQIGHAIPELIGTRIGPYKLLEQIGEGGFGVVFMAEQVEPVTRKVALKVIKLGMDTKQVIARFEAERQALAMMDHPNIARVLDAGATDEGRPYFVMEYVRGEPITDYCDKNNLTVRERLELFSEVCHAVQHAHQKGIIHRDIKPSNVLVTFMDGNAVPKVIDFGIAKATNAKLTEKTLFTEHRQLIGTPEYMSPEQAEMSGVDIDTRSDVYSLGVLLYELLTGVTPFGAKTLREAAYGEIQRIIREEEPPKPSTRLSTLGDLLPGVAAHRRTEPKKLGTLVRGELDWIVMRCLEKDRTRRYATASGLAADVLRHLNDEPVEAGPPSRSYRLKKLVRRNKAAFVAAALVFFALTLGVIGTSYGLFHAERERHEAEQARTAEAEQRRIAEASEQRALEEAERALAAETEAGQRAAALEQVAAFQEAQLSDIDTELMGINFRLGLIDKRRSFLEGRGMDEEQIAEALADLESSLTGVNFTNVALAMLDENIFERALIAIDEQFTDQPEVRARLFQTIASTLREIGLLDRATAPQVEALDLRRRVLGDEHPDTLTSISNMGGVLYHHGNYAETKRYLREALETRRRVLGDEHPDTLTSINNMGLLLRSQGKLAEAEPYWREAMEAHRRVLGDEHPQTLRSISNMGVLLRAQGKLAEAEPYYREALETRRRVLGDEHPQTLTSISNMSVLLLQQGKLAEAKPYFREALEVRRHVLGDEHPDTLVSINNMGTLLRQ